jgi:RHS repeat-associated protein
MTAVHTYQKQRFFSPRRIEYAGANVKYAEKYLSLQQTIKDRYAKFEVPYLGKNNDDYVNGQGFCCDNMPANAPARAPSANDNPELFQYYYHSDHLGSTSLITNLDGEVVQHVEYVPFGEVFIEERNNKWNTPYLFNAKELDEETGLYYYGARYYEPRVSQFLSVDRFAEKYPFASAYSFCLNNPIKFEDIRGDSTAILNMGSGLNQHTAMLVQNEQNKWQYYSANGDNVYVSGQFSGGRPFNDIGVGEWNNPQEFLDDAYNTRATGDEKQTNKNINGYGFTAAYVIPTTPEQDKIIRETFTEISQNESYDLIGNNCATVVLRSYEAAGIQTYNTNMVRTYVPANHKLGESGFWVTYPADSRPFVPSSAFRSVQRYNPRGFLLYPTNNKKHEKK